MLKRGLFLMLMCVMTGPVLGTEWTYRSQWDGLFSMSQDTVALNGIFTQHLRVSRRMEGYKLFSEGRVRGLIGPLSDVQASSLSTLSQGYGQFFLERGDLSVGKRYTSFGNPGLFNPFDPVKTAALSDPGFIKEGQWMARYDTLFTDEAGLSSFVGLGYDQKSLAMGLNLFTTIDQTDWGLVIMKQDRSRLRMGGYMVGDWEWLGFESSVASHWDDSLLAFDLEYSVGLDTSYDQVFFKVLYAYHRPDSGFLKAQHYVLGRVLVPIDEFLTVQWDVLHNSIDGSGLVSPSLQYSLAPGWQLFVYGVVVLGDGDQEFSKSNWGPYTGVIRVNWTY